MTTTNHHFLKSTEFYTLLITILLFLLVSDDQIKAQNFSNSDLEGTIFSYSSLPTGWDPVVVGDPVSLASNANIGDTPDLCNSTLPNIDTGMGGIAFSGNTFLSGLRMTNSVNFHEGIQQTVTGLIIGETYTLEFYQSVVKQIFALDNSGSWSVYIDDVLLEVTAPSNSSLAFDNPNLVWDARSIIFNSTSSSHTFKFMPTDDDTNLSYSFTDTSGGLRMGIDLITINADCNLNLGPDVTLCTADLPYEISTSLVGTYEWNTDETTPSIMITESGIYTLAVNSACGVLIDSVSIDIVADISPIDLGDDLEVCPQDYPIELSTDIEGDYIWNTTENTQSIFVNEPGEYNLTVFNACGAEFDSIIITEAAASPNINLGDDLFLCADDFPVSLDAGVYDSYTWASGEDSQIISATGPGDYAVTVANTCGTASDDLTITLVESPSEISLGEDISVCENLFPVSLIIEETELDIIWSTGSSEQQISVNSGGIYSVEVSNQCGISAASILVSSVPNPIEAESLIICQGESVDFLGETYFQEGQYQVVVPSIVENECDTFWNINVSVIPTDTLSVYLEIAEGETANYLGNNFSETGTYFLSETVEDGCDKIIRILVNMTDEVFVYVPSAFSPNEDGLNELFKPVLTLNGDISLSLFEFEIYDRYGHIIYESTDALMAGWNGSGPTNKDYFVQDGVYTWVLRYGTTRGADTEIEYGSVVIMR